MPFQPARRAKLRAPEGGRAVWAAGESNSAYCTDDFNRQLSQKSAFPQSAEGFRSIYYGARQPAMFAQGGELPVQHLGLAFQSFKLALAGVVLGR